MDWAGVARVYGLGLFLFIVSDGGRPVETVNVSYQTQLLILHDMQSIFE